MAVTTSKTRHERAPLKQNDPREKTHVPPSPREATLPFDPVSHLASFSKPQVPLQGAAKLPAGPKVER